MAKPDRPAPDANRSPQPLAAIPADPPCLAIREGDGKAGASALSAIYVMSGKQTGQRFLLEEPEHLVGRDDTSSICIDDDQISRRHAKLVLGSGRVAVHDLGSAAGTFVNEQRVVEPRVLEHNDRLQCGGTILKFVAAGTVDAAYLHQMYEQARTSARTSLWQTILTEDHPAHGEGDASLWAIPSDAVPTSAAESSTLTPSLAKVVQGDETVIPQDETMIPDVSDTEAIPDAAPESESRVRVAFQDDETMIPDVTDSFAIPEAATEAESQISVLASDGGDRTRTEFGIEPDRGMIATAAPARTSRYEGWLRAFGAVLSGFLAGMMIPQSLQTGVQLWFPDEIATWNVFFWGEHWIVRIIASWAAAIGAGVVAGAIARRRGAVVGALAAAPSSVAWLAMGVMSFGFRYQIGSETLYVEEPLGNQASTFILALTLPLVAALAGTAGEDFGRQHGARFDSRRASLLGVRVYHFAWLPLFIHLLLVQAAWSGFYFLNWFRIWYKDEGESYRGLISAVFCGLLLASLGVMARGSFTAYRLLSGLEQRASRLRWLGAFVGNLLIPPVLAAILQVGALSLETAALRYGTLLVAAVGIAWYFLGSYWASRPRPEGEAG